MNLIFPCSIFLSCFVSFTTSFALSSFGNAGKSKYAIIILSHNTITSFCAREEIQTLKLRYFKGEVTVFPVLYELKPSDIPPVFAWIKKLIFKEADFKVFKQKIDMIK